jgi:excisionase family DNA binding protein
VSLACPNCGHDLEPEPHLSTERIAELFEVTAETVRNWIEKGSLPGVKVNGYFRIPLSAVRKLAKGRYGG